MSLSIPNNFGLFYYGPDQISIPFGDGFRCVGGAEVFRLEPATLSGGFGENIRPLDYNQAPMNAGAGMITPSSTFNFQYWYRDPNGATDTFNLSNGLEVTFCP